MTNIEEIERVSYEIINRLREAEKGIEKRRVFYAPAKLTEEDKAEATFWLNVIENKLKEEGISREMKRAIKLTRVEVDSL